MILLPFESIRIFEPRESITSIVSVLSSSQGLAVNAYGFDVSAPTGHKSIRFPCNSEDKLAPR